MSRKSIVYDRDYGQGDFRVVRNIQANIDLAVVEWEGIVAELRRLPRGETFDFSQFDEILAVVCTPFAAYSSEDRILAFIKPNLQASIVDARAQELARCRLTPVRIFGEPEAAAYSGSTQRRAPA